MPPLPTISQVVRGTATGLTARGTRWANVMNFRCTSGAPTPSDLVALDVKLAAMYDQSITFGGQRGWLWFCTTTTTMDTVKLLPLDGASASTVFSHALAGHVAGTSMPTETSLVLTLRTGLRGPRHRGRIYLPPQAIGSNDTNGTAFAADIAGHLTMFAAWQVALQGVNWELAVASYKHADWNLVTSFSMDGDFDVQRRRKS